MNNNRINKILHNMLIVTVFSYCANLYAQDNGSPAVASDSTEMEHISSIRTRFGSIATMVSINASELDDQYVTNVGSLLGGRLPGLTVLQSGGEPGNDQPQYFIRGRSSWNTSAPKIYVDGFEVPIDNITLSEIESISVIKSPGALSGFGMQSANGIIWVVTKRGVEGKPKVNVNFYQGWQSPIYLPESIDSYTYASMYNEAVSNDRRKWSQYYTEDHLKIYKNGGDGFLYPDNDWQDILLKDFSHTTNANVMIASTRRGTDRYGISLSCLNRSLPSR